MKQFDLNTYLRLKEEGKEPKIVTRDGCPVRILCTDMKSRSGYSIAVLILRDGTEMGRACDNNGICRGDRVACENDLFFADPEPKYRPYKTIEEVLEAIKEHGHYVKDGNTIRILEKFTDMGDIAYHFSGWTSSTVRTWEYVHDKVTWADGAPFGVKEEDGRALELEDGRRIEV